MRYYRYIIPADDAFGQSVEVTLSEEEIIKEYWDDWCMRMIKRGENIAKLSKDRCIVDWCAVNWAWEIKREAA
jgi:hypothetical protein